MGPDPNWTDDNDFGADLDPISREAVTWFAAMHADDVPKADQIAFRAWLRRDDRHRAVYKQVERLWSGASELPIVKTRRNTARLAVTRRALGKGVLAAMIGGGAWVTYQQHPFADYRTGTGERRTVTLADHSTVEMAGSTVLSVDFGPRLRLVTLHRGEAYFSVAPEQSRPFVVKAAAGRTMALGTSFNVDYISDDDVRITVARHAVDVRVGAADARLDAGSQLTYGRESIGDPQHIDPVSAFGWRDGRLVFLSQPFGRVIASLNRWRPGRLMVMGSALAARPVTLIVDLEKSGNILATLENTLPIRAVNVTPYLTLVFEA
ncbi:MAG: iron dicitrate transporter FecR [Nitrobacter sp.]|uniref:FecR family protein n=1 Tax=Nitrobacter sp. TaxID=29420 RepID=UPI00387DDD05